jgi:hypothetical protein
MQGEGELRGLLNGALDLMPLPFLLRSICPFLVVSARLRCFSSQRYEVTDVHTGAVLMGFVEIGGDVTADGSAET